MCFGEFNNPLSYLSRFLVMFFLFQVFIACGKESESVQTLSLDDVNEDIELKLTDIMTDIKIVSLEFIEDYPLTNRSQINIGEKYIICTSSNALLQYKTDGQFVRVLAIKGRGPNEIVKMSYPVVDENELYVYLINNYKDGKIERINLETGEFEDPIKVSFSSAVETFACIDNDLLLVIPSNWAPSMYYYFIQNMKGEFLSGFEMERERLIQLNFNYIRPYKMDDNFIFFHSKFTKDTVFRINQNAMKPFFIFGQDESPKDPNMPGYSHTIRGCTNEYFFIERWFSESFGKVSTDNTFFIATPSLKLQKINNVINDIIGSDYENDDLRYFFWDKLIAEDDIIGIEISSLEFINSVSENYEQINKSYSDKVVNIASKLSENDNQVLIYGKPIEFRIGRSDSQ